MTDADGMTDAPPIRSTPDATAVGSRVRVVGLTGGAQYNDYVGRVESVREDGRWVISLRYMGEPKQLALKSGNADVLNADEMRAAMGGKVTDVVQSLEGGVGGRTRGTKQALDSAIALIKLADDSRGEPPSAACPCACGFAGACAVCGHAVTAGLLPQPRRRPGENYWPGRRSLMSARKARSRLS